MQVPADAAITDAVDVSTGLEDELALDQEIIESVSEVSMADVEKPTSSPAEEVAHTPDTYVVEIDGQPREFSSDELAEIYRGYLRNDDYTRKAQELSEWYRVNEARVQAVEALDTWMQSFPDKAAKFQELLMGLDEDVDPDPESLLEAERQRYLQQYSDSPQGVEQEAQYDPDQDRMARAQQMQEWWRRNLMARQLQAQQEDLQLANALNYVRQTRGDFDERELLGFMQRYQVNDPITAYDAIARQRAYARAAQQAASRPVQQARVESSTSRGGVRGVKANTEPEMVSIPDSWEEAAKLAAADPLIG
jgi:hypothetical protein